MAKLRTACGFIECTSLIEIYWSLVSPFHDSLYFDFLKAHNNLVDAVGFGVSFEMGKKCYRMLAL